MKKLLLFLSICFVNAFSLSQAQNVLDGTYVREHYPTRKVVELSYLREADVMWNKRIWRVIDLNEKINAPLRYPLSNQTESRKNLMNTLMDAIKEGTLTAYKTVDDEFTSPMTKEEMDKIGGAGWDTVQVTDPDPPYLTHDSATLRVFSTDNVIGYRLKEETFFDKQRSLLETRIIGIAPLILARDENGNLIEGGQKIALFWVYYPEARKILVNEEYYHRQNDAQRMTYDDLFLKRMFNSYIIKESNVYNRYISEYRIGIDALLESERIKHDIINMEHDLWEY